MVEVSVFQPPLACPWVFMGWDAARGSFDAKWYVPVWRSRLEGDFSCSEGVADKVYDLLNAGDSPDGYASRSLSTGDIVQVGDTFWYCDRVGWVNVTKEVIES